jgi:hypothetical protein
MMNTNHAASWSSPSSTNGYYSECVNGKVWGIPILHTIPVGVHLTPMFYTCCHRDLCNRLCLSPKWHHFPYLVHYFWPEPLGKPIELCSKVVHNIWDRVPFCDATCAFSYLAVWPEHSDLGKYCVAQPQPFLLYLLQSNTQGTNFLFIKWIFNKRADSWSCMTSPNQLYHPQFIFKTSTVKIFKVEA